jgi:hypothetical protein
VVFFLMAMDHMDQFEPRETLTDFVRCRTLNHSFWDDFWQMATNGYFITGLSVS